MDATLDRNVYRLPDTALALIGSTTPDMLVAQALLFPLTAGN